MNDCHYYIKEVGIGEVILVAGIAFDAATGTYYLPCGEGMYSVSTELNDDEEFESYITMIPRGSGREYRHPNFGPQ
jgi:hypothetical protein